jgi:phage terminase small subunit
MIQALTAKQERFVQEIVAGESGAESARRAGYAEASANVQASQNLSKPNIAEAVARSRQEVAKRAGITQERLFKEMAGIAFSDIRELLRVESDGTLVFRKIEDIPASAWAAIKEVTAFRLPDGGGMGVKFQLWDKVKALALLGNWLLDETDPSKPDGKQVINTKIIINAVEGGKQKSKILLNGKPLEKREDTVSK